MRRTMITFIAGAVSAWLFAAGWSVWEGRALGQPGQHPPATADEGGMKDMDTSRSENSQAPVVISPERRQQIGVKTETVAERRLAGSVRTVGTVAYDERRLRRITLRVSGWITELHADFTGKPVSAGEPLFEIYSPELASSQQEYLLALRTLARFDGADSPVRGSTAALVESARARMVRSGLTDEQLRDLAQRGRPETETTIHAPIGGIVTKKEAVQGMYVTPEMTLYELADLSTVWLMASVYDPDLARVQVGQTATAEFGAYPGEAFHGRIAYIDPALDEATRTVRVRIELPNRDGRLKPGLYGSVTIAAPGETALAVPAGAVLDSGTRRLVFVDHGEGRFEPREVVAGHAVDGYYPVRSGLAAGDRVVTSATFLIDSESKLMAAANMMGALGMGGIRMEQAQMGEMEMPVAPAQAAREQTVDGLTLALASSPEPPKKGANLIRVTVRTKDGPVTDARVTFGYTMAMPGMEVETVPAKHAGNGVYEARLDFGMKGGWTVDVTVARGAAKPVTAQFALQAN